MIGFRKALVSVLVLVCLVGGATAARFEDLTVGKLRAENNVVLERKVEFVSSDNVTTNTFNTNGTVTFRGTVTLPIGTTMSAANLTAGTRASAIDMTSVTGIVDSCVLSSAAIKVTKLGTGLTIPANSASSLTNLQAANLEGNIAQARIATALSAPGAIGGSTPAASAFTEVTIDGVYAVTGPDASMGMSWDTGGPVTNGQTVAYTRVFGAGTVRVFLTPLESTATVPWPSTVTTTNFVVNGEAAKTHSWYAIGPRP